MLRWLKRALTRNLLLKLTALVCAVVVWVHVDAAISAVREVDVPVSVYSPAGVHAEVVAPKGVVLDGGLARVRLTVRGPRRLLEALPADGLREHQIGWLRGTYEGEHVLRTDAEGWRELPRGLRVVKVEPSEITVQFTRIGPRGTTR